MDLRAILTSMVLIGVGWILVSQQPPAGFGIIQSLGWIPLAFGFLIGGLSVKEMITA